MKVDNDIAARYGVVQQLDFNMDVGDKFEIFLYGIIEAGEPRLLGTNLVSTKSRDLAF